MRPITKPRIITQHLNKYLREHNMNFITFAGEFLSPYNAGYITGLSEYKPRKAKAELIRMIVDDCMCAEFRGFWQTIFRGEK